MEYTILGTFNLNAMHPISTVLAEVNETMESFGFSERVSIKSTARIGTVNASRAFTNAEKEIYCMTFMQHVSHLLPGLISVTLD